METQRGLTDSRLRYVARRHEPERGPFFAFHAPISRAPPAFDLLAAGRYHRVAAVDRQRPMHAGVAQLAER